jgi:hypothetical protein
MRCMPMRCMKREIFDLPYAGPRRRWPDCQNGPPQTSLSSTVIRNKFRHAKSPRTLLQLLWMKDCGANPHKNSLQKSGDSVEYRRFKIPRPRRCATLANVGRYASSSAVTVFYEGSTMELQSFKLECCKMKEPAVPSHRWTQEWPRIGHLPAHRMTPHKTDRYPLTIYPAQNDRIHNEQTDDRVFSGTIHLSITSASLNT